MVEEIVKIPTTENDKPKTKLVIELTPEAVKKLKTMFKKAKEEGKPLELGGLDVLDVSELKEDTTQSQ